MKKRRTSKKTVDKKQNKEIAVLKKQVKALGKTLERKYRDKEFRNNLDGPLTTGISVFEINAIPVYNGNNSLRHFEREGQSINMRSFKMRGTIQMSPIVVGTTNPPPDAQCRLMLVLFPENQAGNSAGLELPDVLQLPDSQPFTSYNKIDGRGKYKVLYDRVFRLQNPNQVGLAGGTTNRFGQCTEKWRIPFNINVKFGKSGKQADYLISQGSGSPSVSNRLVLFSWSDYGGANLSQAPYINAMSRFRFDDI